MTIQISEVHDALRKIVANQDAKALNYCVNYAKAGLYMSYIDELKTQVLYVLNNMTHWRGDDAKLVRTTLKQFVKEN